MTKGDFQGGQETSAIVITFDIEHTAFGGGYRADVIQLSGIASVWEPSNRDKPFTPLDWKFNTDCKTDQTKLPMYLIEKGMDKVFPPERLQAGVEFSTAIQDFKKTTLEVKS